MTLIIVLNAVFAAFVLVSIVGLHLYAIAKDRSEQVVLESTRIAPSETVVEPRPNGRDLQPAEAYRRVPVPARA
jgi:hypothetical protein